MSLDWTVAVETSEKAPEAKSALQSGLFASWARRQEGRRVEKQAVQVKYRVSALASYFYRPHALDALDLPDHIAPQMQAKPC